MWSDEEEEESDSKFNTIYCGISPKLNIQKKSKAVKYFTWRCEGIPALNYFADFIMVTPPSHLQWGIKPDLHILGEIAAHSWILAIW